MTVYFDLDRVLADFAKQAERYRILKRNNRINWIKMFLIGSGFWSTMEFFPGARESFFNILSYCKENNIRVRILSSVHLASGKKGKIKWCREMLLLDKKDVIIVRGAEQKADFAASDALLIDDRQDNIRNFASGGGHGFLFHTWDNGTCNIIINLIRDIKNGRNSFNNQ